MIRVIAIILAPILLVVLLVGSLLTGVATGVGSVIRETASGCQQTKSFWDSFDVFSKFVSDGSCAAVCEATIDEASSGYTAEQVSNIKKIIGTGKALKVSEKGLVIAITTALVESGLKNYANDGIYDTSRNPSDGLYSSKPQLFQFAGTSMDYPHEAVGSDASSVGLFQQQAWWGTMGDSHWQNDPKATMARLMDPVFGAQKFYNSMLTVPGWEQMDPGAVAQDVQVSGVPDAYAKRVDEATKIVNTYKDSSPEPAKLYDLTGQNVGDGSETAFCGSGEGNLPLDKNSLYQISAQWAQPRAKGPHVGMDIDCGEDRENVYTMTAGTVVTAVSGNASGSGSPMGQVIIETADKIQIKYLHGTGAKVSVGDTVTPGQIITQCANTGPSQGTHLHIEFNTDFTDRADVKSLPTVEGFGGRRDPALGMAMLGVDICPPYTDNRKSVAPGASMPVEFWKCWPKEEWIR